MPGKISPGIYTSELTFTDYATQIGSTRPAIVGGATKGLPNTPTIVTSEPDLFRKFGLPVETDYGLLAAIQFLKAGEQIIYTRVANGDDAADITLEGNVGITSGTAATGTVALTAQVNNGDTVTVPDAALAATGSVVFNSQPADTDNLVLNDGTNPAVTFEFDNNSSVSETGTLRQVVIGATAAATAVNLQQAIDNAPVLGITATVNSSTVSLVNDTVGTAGNVAITKTDPGSSMTVTGMAGGAASSNVLTFEFDAAVAATGNIDLSSNAADGDQVVIDDGTNPAVTYEFDNDASVTDGATLQGVTIGGDAATTITNLINKINTPTAGAVIGITASAGAGDSADLTNDTPGTAGNVAITDPVDGGGAITVTGMSGGLDSGTVGGGNIAVTIGASATVSRNNLLTALQAQTTAGNTAVTAVSEDVSGDPGIRVNNTAANGAAANVTITESTSAARIAVTGFQDGVDANPGTPATSMTISAISSGSWGNNVRVEIVRPSSVFNASAASYDIVVSAAVDNSGIVQVVERFNNVQNDSNVARFVEDVLTDGISGDVAPSEYISANVTGTQAPTAGTYTLGQTATNVTAFTLGVDGITGLTDADYVGTITGTTATGLKALRDPEQVEFNVLVVPGVATTDVFDEVQDVCLIRGDCVGLLDPPIGLLRDEVIDFHNGSAIAVANSPTVPIDDHRVAMYWPWFEVTSDILDKNIFLPPSVGALEAFARVDQEIGPWRAPAGFVYGLVTGNRLEFNPNREDRDELTGGTNAINAISDFQSTGLTIFGNDTLIRTPDPRSQLSVTRLLVFLKKTVVTSIQYLLFAPNDPQTWMDFKQTVEPILRSLQAARALETYSIKIDEETNPPEVRAQKTMRGQITLKPTDVAEIIELDFAIESTGVAEFNL